ncbi:hypothetical protein HanPSC8_Chr03g0086361 [Helianthus annuus]|nr:hypothetical protein HanPSC8_Chr03g0086361 [Helianthus annuus]
MHYREESEGVPRVNVSVNFTEQEWYKVLTQKVTSIAQLEERALVAAGMSMLWAPQNPRGVPIYGYQGKAGYSLMNCLDPQADGAMVVATLAEGRPLWLDQIRDRFLHPTSESLTAYANTILGPPQGTMNEPMNEPAGDGVNAPVDTTERLETRKKKKIDKTEGRRLRNQRLRHLCAERDPDDDATLTEIMKKKKVLEDKKMELDEQAAAALAAKKSKLQKETPPAPSESEIDLGVFSAKHGNLLEKIYATSGSQGTKFFICASCFFTSLSCF